MSLPFDPTNRHVRQQFPWAADGIYDHSGYEVRYLVEQGFVMSVISKIWIDNGGPQDLLPAMKLPWGSHPDMPPKPQKQ